MGIKKIDEHKYRLQIRRRDVKHDKVYSSVQEARAVEGVLLGKRSRSTGGPAFVSAVAQYLDSVTFLSKKKKTQNSERSRLRKLSRYFEAFDCSGITKDEVYQYVAGRMKESKGNSPDAVRNEIRALSSLFNFAVEKRWISENPAKNIKLKQPVKKLRRVSSEASGAILALMSSDQIRMRFLARHIALVLNTGARPGELGELKIEDLSLEGDACVIFKDTKNGEERLVPLAADSVELINSQLFERKNYISKNSMVDGGYLFPDKTGKHFYAYSGALRDAKEMGLLPGGLRIHDGRHEFVSTATESGELPDSVIMSLVGHKNPASMKRYQSLKNRRFSSQMDKLSRSFRRPRLAELARELGVSEEFIEGSLDLFRGEHGTGTTDTGDLLYSHGFRSFLKRTLDLAKIAGVAKVEQAE